MPVTGIGPARSSPMPGRHWRRRAPTFLLICTNTMHRVADQVEAAVSIPLLHLADATADRIVRRGHADRGPARDGFHHGAGRSIAAGWRQRGLNVIVPDTEDRKIVHRVIYEELCLGKVEDASRREYLRIIDRMRNEGAEGVIEGCTEIVMLVDERHTDVPLFDTTAIHAEAAVRLALPD